MQKKLVKLLLGVAMLSLAAVSVHAAEFKGVVGIGFDLGGDTLMSGTYSDGSTWKVNANQGLVFNGGVVMVTGKFETQATVGYKFGGPNAENGSVTYDVIPLELIGFYRAGDARMGLGISYHMAPKLDVDIDGSSLNGAYKFDDTMGMVAQVGWAPAGGIFSIDLRYTAVDFKRKGIPNAQEINGSVVGLYGSLFF